MCETSYKLARMYKKNPYYGTPDHNSGKVWYKDTGEMSEVRCGEAFDGSKPLQLYFSVYNVKNLDSRKLPAHLQVTPSVMNQMKQFNRPPTLPVGCINCGRNAPPKEVFPSRSPSPSGVRTYDYVCSFCATHRKRGPDQRQQAG